jgi:hypothetical protein
MPWAKWTGSPTGSRLTRHVGRNFWEGRWVQVNEEEAANLPKSFVIVDEVKVCKTCNHVIDPEIGMCIQCGPVQKPKRSSKPTKAKPKDKPKEKKR